MEQYDQQDVEEREEDFDPPSILIPNVDVELRSQDIILRNKAADSADNEFNKLLSYYRERIDVYEKERSERLQKIEEVRGQLKEKHQLDDKLQELKNNIADIQQSISEQKLAAFAERIAYLNLSRLNADIKIQDIKNRKKIAELIALSEPKRNAVIRATPKYQQGEKGGRNIMNDLNIFQQTGAGRRAEVNEVLKQQVTTVYFPNENLNSIVMENQSLKAQQIQERNAFESQFQALQKELSVREEELRLKQENDLEFENNLKKKTTELERKHYQLNKHYFDTRRKCNERVQKLYDEKQFLQLRNQQLQNKLEITQKTTEIESEVLRDLESKKALEYAAQFQNKSKGKTEQIEVMKEQYAQIQHMYQTKMQELENDHAELAERYTVLVGETDIQKANYIEKISQLQEELQLVQQEQIERGLFPTKPEYKSHEEKLLEEQLRVQNELRLEKIKMRKEKERIYREAGINRQSQQQQNRSINQSSSSASNSKRKNSKKGKRIEYNIDDAEKELDALKREVQGGRKQQ